MGHRQQQQQHLQGVDFRVKEAPDIRLSMTCGPVDELSKIAKL